MVHLQQLRENDHVEIALNFAFELLICHSVKSTIEKAEYCHDQIIMQVINVSRSLLYLMEYLDIGFAGKKNRERGVSATRNWNYSISDSRQKGTSISG